MISAAYSSVGARKPPPEPMDATSALVAKQSPSNSTATRAAEMPRAAYDRRRQRLRERIVSRRYLRMHIH